MIILIAIVLLSVSLSARSECTSDCCRIGGSCGDAVFERCVGGVWDYRTACSPSYLVCCRPQEVTSPRTTAHVSTSLSTRALLPATDLPIADVPIVLPSVAPVIEECGSRLAGTWIVGGANAQPSHWPWIAQLQRDYFGWGGWEHFCGATLISNRWVISAAHCVAKYNEVQPGMFRVVLGEHNRQVTEGSEVTKSISRIIVHEGWGADIKGSPNDIALLELSSPVEFTASIQPACLPSYPNENFYPGDDCWIAGWGDTKGTGDSNILQEVKIDITPYEECKQKWLTGTGGKDYVKTSHVCIGNGVPGACNGDSGGPLVCVRNGRFVLVGATSFGAAGCQETEAPNVYTKISHFLPWILENMSSQ